MLADEFWRRNSVKLIFIDYIFQKLQWNASAGKVFKGFSSEAGRAKKG